jgi:hypothetical protein
MPSLAGECGWCPAARGVQRGPAEEAAPGAGRQGSRSSKRIGRVDGLDRAVHLGHVGARHVQALAATLAAGCGVRVRHAVFEDAIDQCRVDRITLVVDAHHRHRAFGLQADAHRRAGATVAVCVAQHMGDHVFERVLVGPHPHGLAGAFVGHAVDAGVRRVAGHEGEEGVEVERLQLHRRGRDRLAGRGRAVEHPHRLLHALHVAVAGVLRVVVQHHERLQG